MVKFIIGLVTGDPEPCMGITAEGLTTGDPEPCRVAEGLTTGDLEPHMVAEGLIMEDREPSTLTETLGQRVEIKWGHMQIPVREDLVVRVTVTGGLVRAVREPLGQQVDLR